MMVAFAMIIFESSMVSRFFKKGLEMDILVDIGRILMFMIVFYLVIRIETIWGQNALVYLKTMSKETALLLVELGIGFILPFILLSIKKLRHSPGGLFFSALLVIFGFVSNRLNVTITGHEQAIGSSYFPSWMEFVVTGSLIALGFVIFGIAAHYLPIFPEGPLAEGKKKPEDRLHLPKQPVLAISYKSAFLFGLAFVILILIGFQVNKPKLTTVQRTIQAAVINPMILKQRKTVELPANYTFIKGVDSPGSVIFSHENHYDVANPNCTACHPQHFSFLESGKSPEGPITMATMGEGKNCGACHNGKAAFDVMSTDNCTVCHQAAE